MKEDNQITENTAMEVAKVYTFRKLCAKDVPLMVKILTKIKINRFAELLQRENVVKMLTAKEGENDNNALVSGGTLILDVAQIIFEGLGDCEEIFDMLANTSNLSKEEVEALDIEVLMEMIIDFIKKEEFLGFFKAVSKLIK